jgi:hypothetical protein
MNAAGDLALVLHAHLPFIRHPEHRWHLEETWLYEATVATYLPLLDVMRGLARDGVPYRLTLSLSPPLCTMLRDDLLKTRTADYLDRLLRLGKSELARTAGDPTFHKIARFYADRFGHLKALYDELRGDLIGAFRALQDDGFLEIITVGACSGAGRAESGCRSAATPRGSTPCSPRPGCATSSSTRTASCTPSRNRRSASTRRCSARAAWRRSVAISNRRNKYGAPRRDIPATAYIETFIAISDSIYPPNISGRIFTPTGFAFIPDINISASPGRASIWRTRSRTIPTPRASAPPRTPATSCSTAPSRSSIFRRTWIGGRW